MQEEFQISLNFLLPSSFIAGLDTAFWPKVPGSTNQHNKSEQSAPSLRLSELPASIDLWVRRYYWAARDVQRRRAGHGLSASVDLNPLALQAAAGAPGALDQLLTIVDNERLARPAIRSLIVNDNDADDVAQDVLIRVSSGIKTFQGNAKFTTWLHTVARNCAINHLRRKQQTDVELRDDDVSPTQRVSSIISNRQDIKSALNSLPEHYREVVILRDVDGLSYADIASKLGIELGTVRSRLARGRAMAAQALLN